jgi:hypothetical protein
MTAFKARFIALLVPLLAMLAFSATPAMASFGITSFEAAATNDAGGPFTQAGGHPYALTTTFALNTTASELGPQFPDPDQNIKDVEVALPPGLIGDPQALPKCRYQEFTTFTCPPSTQVGTVALDSSDGSFVNAVYNMVPRVGEPAEFAAYAVFQIVIDFKVRTGRDYGITAPLENLSTGVGVTGSSLTIWGVPADPSHDDQRCENLDELVMPPVCDGGGHGEPHAAGVSPKPLLTLPTSCQGPQTWTMRADSWQAPGDFSTATATVPATTGCGHLDFSPQIAVQPSTTAADSPSGLDLDLGLPQNENPDGTAEADLKDAVVELPAGMTVDPSAAEGLEACSEAEVGYQGGIHPAQFSPGAAECPAASKLGNVSIRTPLLDHPLPGAVYLARQTENPFGSLLALYLAVSDPISGVVIKLPGKVELDPATGRLTASFEENPQLPFEELELELFPGSRAALTTPSTCGTYTTATDLTPWTSPEGADADLSSSFSIASGANGSACVASEAQMTNAPKFEAGTATPLAGTYSPFVLKVDRENGSQKIGAIDATLPEGLLGKLAGVTYCSDVAIAKAESRSGLGQGAVEQSDPSCPASSEIGKVKVGAGSGSPTYVQGHAYLAGPYKGAPFSLVVITPAVAGPFDLGSVVIRNALYLDPLTTQIHAVSDPIPQSLAGIPLEIRSITIELDRPNFTLNPTSCEAKRLLGSATSTFGQVASLQNNFQVGGCNGLAFKPKLSASTQGKTSKADGTSLHVKLVPPHQGPQPAGQPEEANVSRIKVDLPKQLPSRLTTLQKACTSAQFDANPAGCPAASVVGTAVAHTPLLASPLTGPAYFVSHGNEAFPQLVLVLQGENITVHLVGDTFISKAGITSSTFAHVPDVPVSSFELTLPQGRYSALAANANLCTQKLAMPTEFVGQNGTQIHTSTPISVTGCKPAITVVRHKVKGKTASIVVSVPSAGTLVATGSAIKRSTKRGAKAGTVTVGVTLSKRDQRVLAKNPSQHVKVTVNLRFTSKHGAPLTARVKLLMG